MFKNTKKICAAGLAALTLMFSAASISADAAYESCTHSWTVEEQETKETKGSHQIDPHGTCYTVYTEIYYNIRCRSCGKIVGIRPESSYTTHSINH